jgi:hypothetical protein
MSIELYRQYAHVLENQPHDGRMMPYHWSQLPHQLSAAWMPYGMMLDEFAQDLANAINDLTHREHRLRAWAEVLRDETPEGKLEAHHALVDDVAVVGLNLPYVIKSRFLFAAAHLCHQANKALGPWQDDLPMDRDVWMEAADKVGQPWKKYGKLKARMQVISGADYRQATANFRDLYNHRFAPRVSVGETQFVTRNVGERGTVSYALGSQPPLELADVAAALRVQRDRAYSAFDVFQTLVKEHATAIAKFGL